MYHFLLIRVIWCLFLAMTYKFAREHTRTHGNAKVQHIHPSKFAIAIAVVNISNVIDSNQDNYNQITTVIMPMTKSQKQKKAETERRWKEREEEEKAAAMRLEEEKKKAEEKKREEDKKKRAAEKKAEEEKKKQEEEAFLDAEMKKVEEEKKRLEKEEEERAAKDKADANINDHLQDLNGGGGSGEDGTMEEEGADEPPRDSDRSPQKKKSRKSKKKEKDEKKKKAEEEEKKKKAAEEAKDKEETKKRGRSATRTGQSNAAAASTAPKRASSVLRKSTWGNGTGTKKTVVTPVVEQHNHKHKRVIGEASVVLVSEGDKYQEFAVKLGKLIDNGIKIDPHFELNAVKESDKEVWKGGKDVSSNMTDVGGMVKYSGGNKNFEQKKVWENRKQNPNGPDEYTDPTVYFTFCFSCDEDPEELLERLSAEWGRMKGGRLEVKELASFATVTTHVLYCLHNQGHIKTIIMELTGILTTARDLTEAEGMLNFEDDGFDGNRAVPRLGLRRNVPKIPGQDTSQFNNYPNHLKQARKCFHLEVDKSEVTWISLLIEQAKSKNLLEGAWGRQVMISEVLYFESPKGDIYRMAKVSRDHINFHASMSYNQFQGFLNIDEEVPFYHLDDLSIPAGTMSLRFVIYTYFKMEDGHSLVAEIHQRGPMGAVEVVVPNTPAAEHMVVMMNKQMGAYIFYYLTTVAMLPESFVQALINKSVDPGLLHNIKDCEWDKEKRIITTAQELAEDKKQKEYSKATWYQDAVSKYSGSGNDKKKGGQSNYAAPEAMYNLDEEKSVKTIHQRNDGRTYAGTEGAPVIDLNKKFGGDKEEVEVDNEADEDDMSAISQLSYSELVERYRKLKTKTTGSAPKDQDNKSRSDGSVIDVEDSSSSSSSSYLSSNKSEGGDDSISSAESVTPRNAAPSG